MPTDPPQLPQESPEGPAESSISDLLQEALQVLQVSTEITTAMEPD